MVNNRNLFLYCDNNPIIRSDSTGAFWISLISAVAGAAIGAVVSVCSQIFIEHKLVGQLPTTFRWWVVDRRLHTNTYYGWANSVIISAYNKGQNRNEQKRNVGVALSSIRAMILTMNEVAPW